MVPSWADQLLPQLLMEQFDTFPIQCRHIEHMHEGVWFRKNNFWQNDSCENLGNFSLKGLLYMHRWCLHGRINSYHSFWWSNLILSLYNVDTLNICMKEFIVFVCTDSTEIFSNLRSAGSNYNLPCFFTDSYCAGFMINLHESMWPGWDRTRDPWIGSQTRICCKTRYRLRYVARWYVLRVNMRYDMKIVIS